MNYPLEGINVLELSTVVAAPTAARVLCAYGATVVKVERLLGDEMRRAGLTEKCPIEDFGNPLFTVHNSNKKLVSIDLKSEKGMEAFLKLMAQADVFISNVRTQSLERMGLGYEAVHEKFPRLIYAHFAGFGPKGPAANNPGFDSTAFWLRSGPQSDWNQAGSRPMRPSYAFGDMATSSSFVSGILMALIARERTDTGTLIRTSLFASGIWCNAVAMVASQPQFGKVLQPDPLRPADPFANFYKAKDGEFIGVFCNEYKRELGKMASLFGIEDILDNPNYADLKILHETDTVVELVQRLDKVFLDRTSTEWAEYLTENNVACQVVCKTRNVYKDPQAIANDYVSEVEFKDGMKCMLPNPPIEFSEYDRRIYEPTGALGQHTEEIFTEIGYTEEEIAQMRDAKNII